MSMEHEGELRNLWGDTEGLGDVPSPESLARFLQRNGGYSRVVLADGRVVGALLASFDGIRGYFYRLAVDRAWRRQGLASLLVRDATRLLREAGADRINLHLFETNQKGLAFWKSQGWEIYPNLGMMRKTLSP